MDDQNSVVKPSEENNILDSFKNIPAQTIVIFAVLLFLVINAIIVDIKVFTEKDKVSTAQMYKALNAQGTTCSPACNDVINKNLSAVVSTSASTLVAILPSTTPEKSPTPTRPPTPTLIPPYTPTPTPIAQPKEFFIPLGTGSGTYTNWTSIDGIGATVNLANYPNVANIYFEVTMRIPTGNQTASVRLYNATTNSAVSNSTLSSSGGTSTLLTSSSLSLPIGSNSYQVQLQTQLGYTTFIDQARIHIITN